MRFRESRWRLCQYPTCWRSSRFSRCKRWTSVRNLSTSQFEHSTGSINSGEEPLGQQTCTSWSIMTTLVYRDGRDLGRGGFPFIHYKQTCTDGIGEALQRRRDGAGKRTRFPARGAGLWRPSPTEGVVLRKQ